MMNISVKEKITTMEIYVSLFTNKYKNIEELIKDITNYESLFYGAARDIAREVLIKDKSWQWLGYRLDDFAGEVEKIVAKKIQKWYWRAVLGTGKMPICSLQNTISWLFRRITNEYKNLFDKRSKNYIDIRKVDRILKEFKM